MTTVDRMALEQVLSSVDLRVGAGRRAYVAPGSPLRLGTGSVTLVYIVAGGMLGAPEATSCQVDRTRGLTEVTGERVARPPLAVGDAFLSLGRTALSLSSDRGADVMLAELELSDGAASLVRVLPDSLFVTGFSRHEPAAAALANVMGVVDADVSASRSGDLTICRLMATTVLLSVIRAWAERGCAPAGWPTHATDPFLDRVVDAIHDRPGAEWTVESLATIGAMSRSVFAERFRSALGTSPASYVTDVRMACAQRMLTAGRTVSDVSRELGYSSDEGFSRAFRRHTGMTPSTWRAGHRSPALVPAAV
ncbi:MAG: helix-turn-helix transcriptional regulator [Actinomycetota bacterium]